MPRLVLRRAGIAPASGSSPEHDYEVFDDGRLLVGRIFKINGTVDSWWWGVGFGLTGRKSYGTAESLGQAMAAFKAEYERWQAEAR